MRKLAKRAATGPQHAQQVPVPPPNPPPGATVAFGTRRKAPMPARPAFLAAAPLTLRNVRSPAPPRAMRVRCPRRFVRVQASASADSTRRTVGDNEARAAVEPEKRAHRGSVSLVGFLFLFITYMWSVILFVPMVIAHPFVLWRDRATRRFHDYIAMAWMKCSFGSVLVRPEIVHAENLLPPDSPVVYVANHCSYLDIYAFAYLKRRIKYVSKAEIFRLPIVGWAMAMAGNVALERMNRRGQMEAFRKMVAVVRNGLSLVVFPEGTRSATGRLRRFQAGAFRAAKQQNVAVIPVTITGTREVMPSDAFVPLRYPTSPIKLTIHPAIDTETHTVDELRDLAFVAIDSALPPDVQTDPPVKHH